MPGDALRIVEAGYCAEADEEAWIAGILDAVEPFAVRGGALAAYRLRFESSDSFAVTSLVVRGDRGLLPPVTAGTLNALPPPLLRATHPPSPRLLSSRKDLGRLLAGGGSSPAAVDALLGGPLPFMETAICGDRSDVLALVLCAPDPAARAAVRGRHLLERVIAHLGAAVRLRSTVDRDDVDAWLTPSGCVLDARGPASPREERESLAWAVQQAERARGSLRRSAPEEALEIWRGLVLARWSIVDTVERDGRRLLLARRNEPDVPRRGSLSGMERTVAFFAANAHSHKQMAYALGISPSLVGRHLRSAMLKLGVRSRAELTRVYGEAAA